ALDLGGQAVARRCLIMELHRTACVLLTAVSTLSATASLKSARSCPRPAAPWRGDPLTDAALLQLAGEHGHGLTLATPGLERFASGCSGRAADPCRLVRSSRF